MIQTRRLSASWSRLAEAIGTAGSAQDLYAAYKGGLPSPLALILFQIVVSGTEATEHAISTEYWDKHLLWSENKLKPAQWVQVGELYFNPGKSVVVDDSKCSSTPRTEMYDVQILLMDKVMHFDSLPAGGRQHIDAQWIKRP